VAPTTEHGQPPTTWGTGRPAGPPPGRSRRRQPLPASRCLTGPPSTTVEDLQREAAAAAKQSAVRDGLVRAVIAAVLLGGVLAVGYTVLRPATADQIYARILAISDDPAADLRDARPLVELFLTRFPDDPRAGSIRELDRRLAVDALERRARRRPRAGEIPTPIERDYRAAMDRKAESPLTCLAALEAIIALYDTAETADPKAATGDDVALWLDLVRRQIDQVTPLAAREREEDSARATDTLAEAQSLTSAAAEAATDDLREELLARREELLEGLVEIYASRPHVADVVGEARRLLGRPDPEPPPEAPLPPAEPQP
jgi:hypothetical protein